MKLKTVNFIGFVILGTVILSCSPKTEEPETIKDAYAEFFDIGTVLNAWQILGNDSAAVNVAIKNFNTVTAENAMKWEKIHPEPGVFNFEVADKIVEIAEQNNMKVIGHVLLWHSQTPKWVFFGEDGELTSRDTLLARLKNHIEVVLGHYKGKIHGWDVVNEAFNDDGTQRNTLWKKIIGDDYIQKAFEFAAEADPNTELYYNDFNMYKPQKVDSVIKMVNDLREKGVKIDGIGMQGHYGLKDNPLLNEFEASVKAYSELGVKVMITEMDITLLPFPSPGNGADVGMRFELEEGLDPYKEGLPDSVKVELAGRYSDLFRVLLKYSNSVSRVTIWGVNDLYSWRNNWPIRGRSDYPLLFDRQNQPKLVVDSLITLANQYKN
ncbi:MAG: endo-1,4-beta-xylanase [Bacteroidales bacterium]|nr:endo-1,4-beta-xylanase [Bacteroidales bacterium]MBN2819526.1 endo-1,4-beta-xylanase [Bacteroidales bacterium]